MKYIILCGLIFSIGLTESIKNPFVAPSSKIPYQQSVGSPDDQTTKLHPLERYEYSNYILKGIVGSKTNRIAMVSIKNSFKGYIIHVNDILGKNGGKIISIQNDRIIIQEKNGKEFIIKVDNKRKATK